MANAMADHKPEEDVASGNEAVAKEESSEEQEQSVEEHNKESEFPEGEHPLQTKWCFWYDKKSKTRDAGTYQAHLQKLCTVGTVEDFWRHYVHFKRPSQLVKDINLYFFRDGHKPMWEDHPEGGCWILKIKKKHGVLGKMWQDLLFAAIGEIFDNPDVVGIALAIRSKEDLISVWNGDNTDETARFNIGEHLKEILQLDPSTLMEYKFHKQSFKDFSTFRNARPYVFAAAQ